jgi:hypothetical protein
LIQNTQYRDAEAVQVSSTSCSARRRGRTTRCWISRSWRRRTSRRSATAMPAWRNRRARS